MRGAATALASALLAAAAIGQAAHSPRAEAQPAALRATGQALVGNSKEGRAILAGRLGPGDSISGTVTIANMGSAAGNFTLTAAHVVDVPGTPGTALSARLDLAVDDVTSAAAPLVVYRGKLRALPRTLLGSFAPGSTRVYRLTVSWADGGPSDAAYAGSSTSVQFDWSARGSTPSAGGAPPPGGSTPPASDPPRERRPGLQLRLRALKRQRVIRHRGAFVIARCSETCTVRLTARVAMRGSGRAVRVRPASRRLAAGKDTRLKIALPRALVERLRLALRAHRHPAVSITARATGVTPSGRPVDLNVKVIG